jgi:hypothetical protein
MTKRCLPPETLCERTDLPHRKASGYSIPLPTGLFGSATMIARDSGSRDEERGSDAPEDRLSFHVCPFLAFASSVGSVHQLETRDFGKLRARLASTFAPGWHVSSSTWVKVAPYLHSLPEVFDLTFEHLHGAPSGTKQ